MRCALKRIRKTKDEKYLNDCFRNSQHSNFPTWLTISSLEIPGTECKGYRCQSHAEELSLQVGAFSLHSMEVIMSAQGASRRDFLKIPGAGLARTTFGSTAFTYPKIIASTDR